MNNTSTSQKTIHDFKTGDKITQFFVIRKIEMKAKRDGTPYIFLEVGDHSGRISSNLWNEAKNMYDHFNEGDAVKIEGSIIEYNKKLQISVDKIRKAEPSDNIIIKDFVPREKIDHHLLKQKFQTAVQSVSNPFLKKLLHTLFRDSLLERFFETPGGKLWHHAYIGGLLEHTLAVADICDTMAKLYPMADRDLLITGALLHDIGKMDEYGFDKGFIDYTDEGRLWGHISIGAQLVRTVVEDIEKGESFPIELKPALLPCWLPPQTQVKF